MNDKILSIIIKTGTVAVTTVASFIVKSPIINPNENEGVNWKNVFVFVAGIITISLHGKLKNIARKQGIIMIAGVFFLSFLGLYETLYYTNSVDCYDDRIVISKNPVKSSAMEDWSRWEKKEDYEHLLKGYQCSSVDIWEYKHLLIPYYSFTVLYLLIIITFIILVILAYEKYITYEKI